MRVTFLLAAIGRETFWVVADRSLSYSNGKPPVENAIKVAVLESEDGISIIAAIIQTNPGAPVDRAPARLQRSAGL